MSVRLSVLMELLRYRWSDFHENWWLRIFRKYFEKIRVSLKPDKNKGHFVWIATQFFLSRIAQFFLMRNVAHKLYRENQNTYFVFSYILSSITFCVQLHFVFSYILCSVTFVFSYILCSVTFCFQLHFVFSYFLCSVIFCVQLHFVFSYILCSVTFCVQLYFVFSYIFPKIVPFVG